MARASKMENKTPYQKKREGLGLSREGAAEILDGISYGCLYNIEHGKTDPTPEDNLIMAEGYKDPTRCNIFCSHHCGIGRQYVPHVEVGELLGITLNIIVTLNELDKMKDRLIQVCAD